MIASRNIKESGFSLVELMVVSVILVIVIGMSASILSSAFTSYSVNRPRTEAVLDAAGALDLMTMLIRMAGNNPKMIANFQAIDPGTSSGGAYRTIRIRSDYRGAASGSVPDKDTNDPFEDVTFSLSGGNLMKQDGEGTPSVFLTNVSDMTFVYYTSENVLIDDPSANPALIARVDITLTMQSSGGFPMSFTTSAHVRQR